MTPLISDVNGVINTIFGIDRIMDDNHIDDDNHNMNYLMNWKNYYNLVV